MGNLFYSSMMEPIVIPDRLLAHVKVVTATKLRRNESFTLSWTHPDGATAGRTTLWFQPSIPLRFVFDSAEPEQLDSGLLRAFADAASTSAGLVIDLSDPTADAGAGTGAPTPALLAA